MKKLLTLGLLFIALMSQQLSAQIKKGEKMLGGSIGLNNQQTVFKNAFVPGTSEDRITSIEINPQLGFGIGGNWVVGIKPDYTFVRQENENNLGDKNVYRSNIFYLGVFARKFHSFGERLGVFGQADVTYGFGRTKVQPAGGSESKSKSNIFEVFLKPGAFYKISRRFVIEATVGSLGYINQVSKPAEGGGSKTTISRFDLSLSSNFGLGFHVIL